MVRLYNVLRKIRHLSTKETELLETSEPETNAGLNKALDTYRKLIEKKQV